MDQFVSLYDQTGEVLDKSKEAYGSGILKLFDFISTSLPKKDLQQLKFYNKRVFVIYDKYIGLRQVRVSMREELTQLIMGFTKYPEMRGILIKGAEKSYDDSVKQLQNCKGIQKYFDRDDKIADFFEVVYDKFEKEIEGFISTTLNNVTEAN